MMVDSHVSILRKYMPKMLSCEPPMVCTIDGEMLSTCSGVVKLKRWRFCDTS